MTIQFVIFRTLEGDIDQLSALANVEDLASETRDVASWPLAATAVARVVELYSSGATAAPQAQAFFVRHGYLQTAIMPVKPIKIDWELAREDTIAEATMRLEELGDIVDGELRPGEAHELIRKLRG